jgi:SH3-like domain-containing protein
MVVAEGVEARDAPDRSARLVFKVEKGVVLDFVDVSGGWARVRHRTGTLAFIRLSDLWGV